MTNNRLAVGVVGGGLLGMTLSLRLADTGIKVTLIDNSENLGGLLSSCRIGDFVWDRFYHVILLSDLHTLSLLNDLRFKDQLIWGETKTGFYINSNLYSISNLKEFLFFPPLNILDKLRLGWTILYASKIRDWKRLDKQLAIDWLKRHSGNRTFEKVWLPLLKSKLGNEFSMASASFIWAHISRLYAARQTGLKKEMYGYVNGGYKTVINQLQNFLEKKDTTILRETNVRQVMDMEGHVIVQADNNRSYCFDKLILTIPCARISELCPQLTTTEKARLKRVRYQDLLCTVFLLNRSLSQYYITNLADNSFPFTGVIEMTALVDKKNFGGNSLVYLPRYLSKGDYFYNESDEKIRDIFFSALKSIYPELKNDDLIAYCVSRIMDFPIIPTINYNTTSLPSTRTSMKNVFIVNSAQISKGTINVNEIVKLANAKSIELINMFLEK
jgi:protoporphyrinogen oxidase